MRHRISSIVLPSLACWALAAALVSLGYAWGHWAKSRQLEALAAQCLSSLRASTSDTADCLEVLEGARSTLAASQGHYLAGVGR
jgi:hypothetical protein